MHGDPTRFKPDEIVHSGMTAQQLWDKDARKAELAKHHGYKLKTVMWSRWVKNKEQVIQECVEFLTKD